MGYINFTTTANGILFDVTNLAGETLFVFRPSVFHTITRVSVTNDQMSYKVSDGSDYIFSFNGVGASQLTINGLSCASNLDLFNQFIQLL
jgi:hypothetical protein